MIIDVSHWQGDIDWNNVKVDGAIIKACNGKKGVDEKLVRNVNGCFSNHIPFGFYLYSKAKSEKDATEETNHFIQTISKYKEIISLPVYIDLEEKGTEKASAKVAETFIKIMKENGYDCGVYACESWYKAYLKDVKDIPHKWVAKISSKSPSISGVELWQYSDKGTITGIKGNVDLNKNLTIVTTVTNSDEIIAQEVIAGKWGNGSERKRRLTQAGYNYRKIQRIVNKLILG